MAKSIIHYRKATLKDADKISSVLIDFYNMKDAKRFQKHLQQKWKKTFITLLH